MNYWDPLFIFLNQLEDLVTGRQIPHDLPTNYVLFLHNYIISADFVNKTRNIY